MMPLLPLLIPIAVLLITCLTVWIETDGVWSSRFVRWLQARARVQALHDLHTMELWAWWMILRHRRFQQSGITDRWWREHWMMTLGVQRVPWDEAKSPRDLGCIYGDKFVRDDVEHFYAGNIGGYQSWILDAMADDRHIGEIQP